MDRTVALTLLTKTYTIDSIGQKVPYTIDSTGQVIPSETRKMVFATLESISANERNLAGENNLKCESRAVMHTSEYDGEEFCELDGERYSIYRTYSRKKDKIELYLAQKVGD